MKNITYNVLGVMSGTSLDGIDLALIRFDKSEAWEFAILKAETVPYSDTWTQRLKGAMFGSREDIRELDDSYTRYLGSVINAFLEKAKVSDLDAICSHGHTVWHQPENGITVQIGNQPQLAKITGKRVVCDFRVQDVELGGQGAPLVPVGDQLLFSDYTFCLNLGGFANVSLSVDGIRKAYDICAVNTVLNHYAERLGMAYDHNGETARSGRPDPELLKALEGLPFYDLSPPKSLGMEWVEQEVFPVIERFDLSAGDVLATYTLHVGITLAGEFTTPGKILVTGGGAFNAYLMEELESRVPGTVVIPDRKTVEYKEALIFGLLGVLRLRDENNCLKSVTGALRDHSSGQVYEP